MRLESSDCGNHITLKFLIDCGMYSANIIYLVSQMLLRKNLSHDIPLPIGDLLTDMPEKIAID